MTAKQERHLNEIKEKFEHMSDLKYRHGAEEHGGDLEDMDKYDLVENAIAECIDQFIYLITLRSKL